VSDVSIVTGKGRRGGTSAFEHGEDDGEVSDVSIVTGKAGKGRRGGTSALEHGAERGCGSG
jgi:hypothetical protein